MQIKDIELSNVIYLINSVLHNTNVDFSKIQKMDFEKIKKICNTHKITAFVACALLQYDESGYWKQQKNNAIRKTILYENERNKLFSFLESNNIWFLPLKGIILTDLYPEYGIREFSDNDILFNDNYQKQVREYFINNGYTVEKYNISNNDVYYKEPIFNFEMHRTLFNKNNDKSQNEYYKNILDIAHKKDDKHELFLNDNDFYVYYMAHAIKHYSKGGTGLRTLIDIYVMTNKLNLKWDYINNELNKMEILEKANELKDLSLSLFYFKEITNEQEEILEKIGNMGAYGTYKNFIDSKLVDKGKKNYLFERLFIPVEQLELYAPVVYKYRILLPLFYFCRLVKAITLNGKKNIKELLYVLKQK